MAVAPLSRGAGSARSLYRCGRGDTRARLYSCMARRRRPPRPVDVKDRVDAPLRAHPLSTDPLPHRPRRPTAHLFEVDCTIDEPVGRRPALRAAVVDPGQLPDPRVRAPRRVAHARDDAQGPVRLEKVAKDTWRAAPCTGPLTVTIEVYAYDLSVRTAYLDATRGYFNGAERVPVPEGRARRALHRRHRRAGARRRRALARGDDAARATARRRGASARYRAANYDELIDHPVEMADSHVVVRRPAASTHDVGDHRPRTLRRRRLARDLAKVCQWQCDLFGGATGARAPFDRYLFLVTAVGDGYGGLEHRSSTSLAVHARRPARAGRRRASTDDYRRFLGLASHEYFHAWNVKRIKPAAFMPYDLAREDYTRQLWAFEGITSYYDDLALVRSGVIDAGRAISSWSAGRSRACCARPAGGRRASPTRASTRGSSTTGRTRTRPMRASATTRRARSSRSRSTSTLRNHGTLARRS